MTSMSLSALCLTNSCPAALVLLAECMPSVCGSVNNNLTEAEQLLCCTDALPDLMTMLGHPNNITQSVAALAIQRLSLGSQPFINAIVAAGLTLQQTTKAVFVALRTHCVCWTGGLSMVAFRLTPGKESNTKPNAVTMLHDTCL